MNNPVKEILTIREIDVLLLVEKVMQNKEIAKELLNFREYSKRTS